MKIKRGGEKEKIKAISLIANLVVAVVAFSFIVGLSNVMKQLEALR